MEKSRANKYYVQLAIDTLEIEQNKGIEEYKKVLKLLFYKFIDIGISKFYKYYSDLNQDRTISLIQDNKVWFASTKTQNDPFEATVSTDIADLLRLNLQPDLQGIDCLNFNFYISEMQNIITEQNENGREKCGFFSLTEKNDGLLMWSHYANSHKGFCVEYSALDLFFKFQSHLLPVLYQTDLINPADYLNG